MGASDELKERNAELFAMYVNGSTYAEMAAHFGISQVRVGQIILKEKSKLPLRDRAEMIRELAAELDLARQKVKAIMDAPPGPAMSQGRTVPALNPDGTLDETRASVDHGAALEAARVLTGLQARQAKLLGVDSPDRVSSEEVVTVRIEGVDTGQV